MAFKVSSPRLGTPAITSTSTTPALPLGTRIRAVDETYGEGEFIYLKGATNTVAGAFVTYSAADGSTALLATNAVGPVAVAMGANTTNQYGWYQVQGRAVGKVLAGFSLTNAVYTTATPGSVDDAVVSGERVKGLQATSDVDDPAPGMAEFNMNNAYVDDGAAS